MIRIVSAIALAASVFTAVPAMAQDLPTAKVSYADLDLKSDAGQASLRHRVAAAVSAVCPVVGERDLGMMREHATCVATAQKSAEPQIAALIDSATRVASKSGNGAIEIASR